MRILSVDVGTRNLAMVLVDTAGVTKTAKIVYWNVIDMGQIKGTKSDISNLTLETLCDFDDTLVQVDRVYIEQQPRINATMVRVSHTIGAFYQMQAIYRGADIDVAFVPASCKDAYVNKQLGVKRTRIYKERKQRATRVVQGMTLPEHYKKQLDASKKKDDLCDCLLQLLAQADIVSFL